MVALNWTRDLAADDGLEGMAPLPATRPLGVSQHALAPIAGAAGGVIAAALILLTGAMVTPLTLALGGTAAILYLGTAMVSGRRGSSRHRGRRSMRRPRCCSASGPEAGREHDPQLAPPGASRGRPRPDPS